MELYDRATVRFARALSSSETHEALAHVNRRMGFRQLDYIIMEERHIPAPVDEPALDGEHPNLVSLSLSGRFYPTPLQMINGPALMTFEGFREPGTDSRKLNGFRFVLTPGYEESDYSVRELEMMDNVRKIALDYRLD